MGLESALLLFFLVSNSFFLGDRVFFDVFHFLVGFLQLAKIVIPLAPALDCLWPFALRHSFIFCCIIYAGNIFSVGFLQC